MNRRLRSLRRMMLHVTLIPATTVVVIWLCVIAFSIYLLRNTIIRQHNLLIEAVARQCEQYLTETGNMLSATASGIRELPSEYQSRFLTQIQANYPRFSTLYLLSSEGTVIAEADSRISLLGLNFARERFFEPTKQSRMLYFSTPFISLFTNNIAVTGVVPIMNLNRLQAMLVGELDLRVLQEVIETADIGEQGTAFIADPRGTLVAYPITAWVHEQRNIGNLLLFENANQGQAVFEFFRDPESNAWLVGSAKQIAWNWVVITTQPLAVVVRPLILLIVISAIAFGGSVSLFVWAQVTIVRQITRPISRLMQEADLLAQGQFPAEQTVQYGNFYEIVSLYQSFTRMAAAILERTMALQASNEALNALNAALETRVQERTAALELANKELSSFAYVASHDLKAPLRAISRLAQWLAADYTDAVDEQGQEMIALLVGRVHRMENLIEGILEYSRIGRIEAERTPVNLNEVLCEALDNLSPPDHIQIVVAHEFPTLVLNQIRITQVFQNLIGNAIKFLDKPKGEIIVDCVSDEQFWRFSVRDNGPGIAEEYHQRIFEIFQTLQARDVYESTGIGLSLVKKIIEWYGGNVWLESTSGEGSTFWFSLPRSLEASVSQS
ncbi:multi-sensor signal transduction histidine kinase [Candidatus Moduliflexus flocculans]|uniref:histidine kinase n=1 Tax=Candidatus Moduliflexus flocculans TaxID=1499966 RepID=A0A081BP79_9BACT|nr:multi-sensor signal transduction histidine kinase [Candidatus Moduliflexus flocculans]